MKTIIAAIAFSTLTTAAFAGGYDVAVEEPVIMAPVEVADAAAESSAPSANFILGLITVAVFGAAAAN